MEDNRPSIGIRIMVFVFLLIGLYGIYSLWFSFFAALSMINCRTIPFYTHIYVCVVPFLKILFLILPIGIVKLKNWVRILSILLSVGLLAINIDHFASMPTILEHAEFKKQVGYFTIVIAESICFLSIILFFNRCNVKSQFANNTI